MKIIERKTCFHIQFRPDKNFKFNLNAVRSLSEKSYNSSKKYWEVPLTKRVEVLKLKSYCKAEMIKLDESPESIGEIPPLPDLKIDLPIKATLRPYQKQGIAQAMKLKRCIIGDEQGLGKTLQSISSVVGLNGFPCLVIAPSSTKVNWQREWEKFSHKKAIILDNKNKNSWDQFYHMGIGDVFITNYESLKKFFVDYMPPKGKLRNSRDIRMSHRVDLFKSVIVDESHRCKDSKTQQTKFVLRICRGKENVFLLTGTPVVNKPIDLFPQLAIMNQHHNFGGHQGFVKRYCEGGGGASNLKELNFKLNRYCFFRREKKIVAKDLPDKSRQTVLCDITTRKEYDQAFGDFSRYLKDQGFTNKEILRKLRGEIMVKMQQLKRISALGKLETVKSFVESIVESGEKIILFCVHKVIVDALLGFFPDAVTVTGRDNMEKKQESVDSFQTNPDVKIIICNIKAAGVGITLTASSRVGFVEYPWTYADCVQCEDRAHRIGQKNAVDITYFLGQNTLDQKVYDIIQSKRGTANAITGATDKMEMSFIDTAQEIFNI